MPDDLDAFWAATLADARGYPLDASFEPIDSGLTLVDTFDVTFRGFGGQPVKAWLHLPAARTASLPGVVQYIGGGRGRGLPHEDALYAVAGYAFLIIDTRGQGYSWSVGETPDPEPEGVPAAPGSMTRGILDPSTYFYRRVFTDVARAVDPVRAHPDVDPTRVAVTGGSQGGGISLAAAALVPDLAGVATDVPFLCDFPRATTFTDAQPYGEIVRYLRAYRDHVDQVFGRSRTSTARPWRPGPQARPCSRWR